MWTTLAAITASLVLVALVTIVVLNLAGYALTVMLDRKQYRRQEVLAERSASEAVNLALEKLGVGNGNGRTRGDAPSHPRAS